MIQGHATITITELGREQSYYDHTQDNRFGRDSVRRFDTGKETEIEIRFRLSAASDISEAVEVLTAAVRKIGFHVD